MDNNGDEKQKRFSIDRLCLDYRLTAKSCQMPLHEVVGARLGMQIWWKQCESYPGDEAFAACMVLPDGVELVQIFTGMKSKYGLKVDWTYNHEVAHIALGHCEQKKLVYGPLTDPHEREASWFAFSALVSVGENCLEIQKVMDELGVTQSLGSPFAGLGFFQEYGRVIEMMR